MGYISSKCGMPGPHAHEDCVTGPNPFAAGTPDAQTCQCACHDEMRRELAKLRAAGLTPTEIRRVWLSQPQYRHL